ncbi:hypothetical protein [Zunongwangia sp.]|uniref:hypothetical protein n=1 Tax=Zunongwangia sp. TaxID=1965325 RepID=UPI003AA9307D
MGYKTIADSSETIDDVSETANKASEISGDTVKLSWQLLANIDYVEEKTEDYPGGVLNPIINFQLKNLKNHYIEISGYVVPMDENSYALSSNVMSACFFCGMAGPESVMGIQFKNDTPLLKTDQYISLVGIFSYNDTNPEDWIYHIKDGKLLER